MSQPSAGLFPPLALSVCLWLIAACAPPVAPPELMRQVDPKLTLAQVREHPQALKGKMVLWGGRIIRTVNKPQGTLIEVLQLALDYQDRPKTGYDSEGRFIVAMPGFLDPEIYHKNREVTVVGQVQGVERLPVGEVQYDYVLLRGKQAKLWPRRPEVMWGYPPPGTLDPLWGPVGPGPYWFYGPYRWW
jgi:outer membrane lipoprotein